MLVGCADLRLLAENAPELTGFGAEPARLESVETLQVLYEIDSRGNEALLPPALHPTLPPAVTWLVQRCPESPWGPFQLAQCRIECRSGLRPRGFLRAAVVDNPRAAAALAGAWGFATRQGEVVIHRAYDRIRATVALTGKPILEVSLRDPVRLGTSDVYYVANMNLAHTPRGLRLLQIDPDYQVERAERGVAILDWFDAAAWHSEGVRPSYPVVASFSVATVTLPRLRYVCRPEVLAFHGTERVDEEMGSGLISRLAGN